MSSNVGLGGFDWYYSLREELLFLDAQAVFVGFCFFLGIGKKYFDLVQSLCITYELRRKMLKLLLMLDLG